MGHKLSTQETNWLIASLIGFTTFWIFWLSPVHQVTDSNYSLLLSDSLITHRTFTLDQYAIPRKPPLAQDYAFKNGDLYQLEWVRGRLFYFFPPGSSILSVPFVAVAKAFGLSPVNADGTYNLQAEIKLEALLSAILMAIATALFFITSRFLLPIKQSALVALGGALGTQIWSTASRALWSDTWGILLIAIVIYLLSRTEVTRRPPQPELLASLLAWAYFVRPTSNIPILAITIYVALYHRQKLIRFLVTGAVWLGIFVAYSWHYFGKLMPNYYLARRLSFNVFFEAMVGHLISPSRGLLIYVPVLLFVIWLLWRYRAAIQQRRLLWLATVIVLIHFVIICGFDHWWGGFCYGPRLLTSLVPWFVLLAIIGLSVPRVTGFEKLVGGVLLAASVFANARGAIVRETWIWNTVPVNVDVAPERLWNWRQPQMLAGLLRPPKPQQVQVLDGRLELSKPGVERYLWYGWSGPEPESRWTDGREATVIFRVNDPGERVLAFRAIPYLGHGNLSQQRLTVRLNSRELGELNLNRPEATTHSFVLRADAFGEENVLTFEIPNATAPAKVEASDDWRELGVAVSWIELTKRK
jgi:hypothetical protein